MHCTVVQKECKKMLLLLFLLSCNAVYPQKPIAKVNINYRPFPEINTLLNRIYNNSLNGFYVKLKELKEGKRKNVVVVHIGDSHIQPDFMSSEIRSKLQADFGNAGRGLVFPYQLAGSNTPQDIYSKSEKIFLFNRVAHPEINISPGISGFVLQTNETNTTFTIKLISGDTTKDNFNRIKLFTNNSHGILSALSETVSYNAINNNADISLQRSTNEISLTNVKDTITMFWGADLQNGKNGVLVHTIGVNGAKYEQYNMAPLFWQQLKVLKADLFIISLGTNEAQSLTFDDTLFTEQINLFVKNIKGVNPEAQLVLTTPQGSFKNGIPNINIKRASDLIQAYCDKNHIAIWNLYKITNGYLSSKKWFKAGLLRIDGIHFTSEVYRLHGKLFINALMDGYNGFIK